MNIGFDAKRAYHNQTGLGHYSRTLIQSLAENFAEHSYYLFNPKPSTTHKFTQKKIIEVLPQKLLHKKISAAWRSNFITKEIEQLQLDVFHGLSHELPLGLQKLSVKKIVTIHDLIFEKYPHQFPFIDRIIYRKKFKYACQVADTVIAISKQTKQDLIELYNVPEKKIEICYQSCNPAFSIKSTPQELATVKEKYNLPNAYLLYVGSIIERKNLLLICKALKKLNSDMPLVVIGDGKEYKKNIQRYLHQNNLTDKVIFLNDKPIIQKHDISIDLPAIYQLADVFIYPSIYEGFGIPILEALQSCTPVITTNVSCMPETGGNAAYYIDTDDDEALAHAITTITTTASIKNKMIQNGYLHASNFTNKKCAEKVMQVYTK